MGNKIVILDLLFGRCENEHDVARAIQRYQPEYDELTSNFNERTKNTFANNVYAVAIQNNNWFRAEGAVLAGADREYRGDDYDLNLLRSLCVRLNLGIDGLNPSHDIGYCS